NRSCPAAAATRRDFPTCSVRCDGDIHLPKQTLPSSPALHQLESEHAAIKLECPFQIGNLQVHVTDAHSWIDRPEIFAGCEHIVRWVTDRKSTRLNSSH